MIIGHSSNGEPLRSYVQYIRHLQLGKYLRTPAIYLTIIIALPPVYALSELCISRSSIETAVVYMRFFPYQSAGIELTPVGGTMSTTYANNSIVTRTDIGTDSAALLCTTTYSPCCTGFGNPDTQWFFPNGSQVQNNGNLPYYRTRSTNPRSVRLNRNTQGTTTGIFRCDIPDASGALQSIYVGIYDSGTGESCTLSEYSYLVHTQY